MQKKILAILCSAAVIVITGFGISYFMQPAEEEVDEAEELIKTIFYTEITDEDTTLFPLNMSEYQMQESIHAMSHQKVKANQKWGKILLTQARVKRLIEITETKKNEWTYSDIYLDILYRWYEGDFSRADKDHNAIWNLQSGSIGKATGLLSPIEEKNYINGEE